MRAAGRWFTLGLVMVGRSGRQTSGTEGLRVLIAGGGVAALEAVLALRELLGSRPEIELVAPNPGLVLRALAAEEAFGLGELRGVPLESLAADLGFVLHETRVERVDPDRSSVRTAEGEELAYDALLVALGARAEPALPGALSYGGPESNRELRTLLDSLRAGEVRRLAFAVPPLARWPLPLYELALLTARLARRERLLADLTIATHEAAPLQLFGPRASEGIQQLLAIEGIELRTSVAPAAARGGALRLANGERVPAEAVIALPRFVAPRIPGLPQGPNGFVDTDEFMQVRGLERVWAAGDITWFPIKQGGLAAQQADVAARAIAQLADRELDRRPFAPVLRAALLTGSKPRYLRAPEGGAGRGATGTTAPLWWPPSKVAGRLLAPYLARRDGIGGPVAPLEDLEPPAEDDARSKREQEQAEALELALRAAELDARGRDFSAALRWLEVAEHLNLTLPPGYARKRELWTLERALDAA